MDYGEFHLVNEGSFCTNRGIREYAQTNEIDFEKLILDRGISRGTLVDLGCGNGVFLSEIKKAFPEITAIGIDKLSYKNYAPIRLTSDLREICLPSEVADLVVSNLAFQYLRKNPEQAYQEAYRITKPGGMGIIYPCLLDESTLRRILPQASFEIRTLKNRPPMAKKKQLVFFK